MMAGWGDTGGPPEMIEEERRADILKLILYDLNSAIAPRDHRLLAIRAAIEEFDHNDEYKHDEELDLHADKILFQKLALAFGVDRSSEEVELVCTALEMVYRASRARVALSFGECGAAMLPLFVEMLRKPNGVRRREEMERLIEEERRKLEEEIVAAGVANMEEEQEEAEGEVIPPTSAEHHWYRHHQRDGASEVEGNGEDDGTMMGATFEINPDGGDDAVGGDGGMTVLTEGGTLEEEDASTDGDTQNDTLDDTLDDTLGENDGTVGDVGTVTDTIGSGDGYNEGGYKEAEEASEVHYEEDSAYVGKAQSVAPSMTPSGGTGDTEVRHHRSNLYQDPGEQMGAIHEPEEQLHEQFGEKVCVSNGFPSAGSLSTPGEEKKYEHAKETTGVAMMGGSSHSVPPAPDDAESYPEVHRAHSVGGHSMGGFVADGFDKGFPEQERQPQDTVSTSSTDGEGGYQEHRGRQEEMWQQQQHEPQQQQEHEGKHHQQQQQPTLDAREELRLRAQEKELRRRIRIFEEELEKTAGNDDGGNSDKAPSNPIAVCKILKVLRYFSRVLSAMVPMTMQPGLLDALVYQLEQRRFGAASAMSCFRIDDDDESERDKEDEEAARMNYGADEYGEFPRRRSSSRREGGLHAMENEEPGEEVIASRVDAIATVVNLACAEENKVVMLNHPGLLDAIIRVAHDDPSDEAREHSAIVIMNLAYADVNKVQMVSHDRLLDTLVKLVADESPFTRRYASAALFTLACVVSNTARMACHCEGAILEALRRVLLEDPIDEARINASEALFNMARNNTDETVQHVGNHPGLLESLGRAVITDYSADVRAYAARALEWLAADVHHPMPCHPLLLSALTMASQWTKTTCIVEALKTQATLAENRIPMVGHPGLLDALATLALLDGANDDEARACAISAIERLTTEPSTRHVMVQNERIMTALTKASFSKNHEDEGGGDDAASAGDDSTVGTAVLVKTALKNLAEAW